MFELRTYYEDINNKISDFITWQDNTKGMKANLPRIQDSYKDLLFRYWYIRLNKVEEAIYRARDLAGQVTKTVRESLTNANLIIGCQGERLLDTKTLIEYWHNKSKEKEDSIKKLSKLNLEYHQQFLVKPYGQLLVLHSFVNTTEYMLPPLSDALLVGQMQIRPAHPPELKLMEAIYRLREQMGEQSTSHL